MANIALLATELSTDPLVRGYSGMSDAAAAVSLNGIDREGAASADAIRSYCLLEKKGGMSLLGRISVIAESAVASDPFGDGISVTLEHITNARAMLHIMENASNFSLNLNDSRFDVIVNDMAAGTGCKAIQPADKTAIQALSQNLQSRATELGIGFVRPGDVQQARA